MEEALGKSWEVRLQGGWVASLGPQVPCGRTCSIVLEETMAEVAIPSWLGLR